MFNLQGSEIIFILLLALVVLGPEKLPGAIRKFTQIYGELRKMGTGFQTELKSALDEPMREMRETADLLREQADPARLMNAETSSGKAAGASDAERMRRERERAQEIGDRRAAERAANAPDRDDAPGDAASGDDASAVAASGDAMPVDALPDAAAPDDAASGESASDEARSDGSVTVDAPSEATERGEPVHDDVAAAIPVDHEPAELDEWADPIDLESARERRKNGEASA